ncbi:MAG: DUF2950 domain-containing protein [Burkholderiaceae bacterium]|nr:DUF2950 domain-containing protein [Burkholderiaceae bacterium]
MKTPLKSARTNAALAMLAAVALLAAPAGAADSPDSNKAKASHVHLQGSYASPEEAAKALADAMRSDENRQIWRVLGPGAGKLIHSGDPVQDERARKAFIAAYDQSVKFDRSDDGRVTLLIGPDDFPFPYPLVTKDDRWQFDAKQGDEHVLNRRIGHNELSAIKVCLAYVDAQREYATTERRSNGLLEYAQRLTSSPGEHDGLYWETKDDEPASPLGPLIAHARSQGYSQQSPDAAPYHGYYYKILTGQGKDAPGGAYDYIVNGKMIGGFALVAYPARWGRSGVMTFLCSHEGVVYEKNLGSETVTIASKMTQFDPDASWAKSKDQ